MGSPPTPYTMLYLGGQRGYFQKLSKVSETSDMTSEGLGNMFEGDSADTCCGKFQLTLIGGLIRGSRVRRPGSEDPLRRQRKFLFLLQEEFVLWF